MTLIARLAAFVIFSVIGLGVLAFPFFYIAWVFVTEWAEVCVQGYC